MAGNFASSSSRPPSQPAPAPPAAPPSPRPRAPPQKRAPVASLLFLPVGKGGKNAGKMWKNAIFIGFEWDNYGQNAMFIQFSWEIAGNIKRNMMENGSFMGVFKVNLMGMSLGKL